MNPKTFRFSLENGPCPELLILWDTYFLFVVKEENFIIMFQEQIPFY